MLDQWSNEFAANLICALLCLGRRPCDLGRGDGRLGGSRSHILETRRWRFPVLLDAAAPGLVLVQVIGRIACVITGDAMGKPTSGPFGFAYTSPNALLTTWCVLYTHACL